MDENKNIKIYIVNRRNKFQVLKCNLDNKSKRVYATFLSKEEAEEMRTLLEEKFPKPESNYFNRTIGLDNCLATTHPDLAKEWNVNNKLTPYDVSYGSQEIVDWNCQSYDHIYSASIKERAGTHKTGCSICSHRISKPACEIREFIGENILQQEIKLGNSRYKADLFHEISNTCIEFNGTYWHGDPRKHKSEELNKKTNKTFGECYEKTLEKEKNVLNMGINLITIWELDWNEIKFHSLIDKFKTIILKELDNMSKISIKHLIISKEFLDNHQ